MTPYKHNFSFNIFSQPKIYIFNVFSTSCARRAGQSTFFKYRWKLWPEGQRSSQWTVLYTMIMTGREKELWKTSSSFFVKTSQLSKYLVQNWKWYNSLTAVKQEATYILSAYHACNDFNQTTCVTHCRYDCNLCVQVHMLKRKKKFILTYNIQLHLCDQCNVTLFCPAGFYSTPVGPSIIFSQVTDGHCGESLSSVVRHRETTSFCSCLVSRDHINTSLEAIAFLAEILNAVLMVLWIVTSDGSFSSQKGRLCDWLLTAVICQ